MVTVMSPLFPPADRNLLATIFRQGQGNTNTNFAIGFVIPGEFKPWRGATSIRREIAPSPPLFSMTTGPSDSGQRNPANEPARHRVTASGRKERQSLGNR